MRPGPYFIILLLAVACVILTAALMLIDHTNQNLQVQLQARQQALNQGILGQQAQQISGGVLQDLASAAIRSHDIHQLLEKYGYRVSAPRSQISAMNSQGKTTEETTNTEEPKP